VIKAKAEAVPSIGMTAAPGLLGGSPPHRQGREHVSSGVRRTGGLLQLGLEEQSRRHSVDEFSEDYAPVYVSAFLGRRTGGVTLSLCVFSAC
jgi:hypothetical protein